MFTRSISFSYIEKHVYAKKIGIVNKQDVGKLHKIRFHSNGNDACQMEINKIGRK